MASSGSSEGMDKLKDVGQQVLKSAGGKAMSTVSDKLGGMTEKLEGIADGGPIGKAVEKGGKAAAQGDSPLLGGLKGAASGIKDKITGGGGGKSGGGKATKSTNIIETIDVGVPVKVAYNQWTEFGAFPSFMKKVENVEAQDDNKITFKAQIFLSHRTWEATILEQVPDERIVWRSKGEKGHVDGAVTFHEIGPNLTRILVVLEYYAQGLFEKTGNIWEAQGRRARAELRHFRRHVMTRTILDPDEVEGWRGTIHDGEVVESHEDAVEREEQEQERTRTSRTRTTSTATKRLLRTSTSRTRRLRRTKRTTKPLRTRRRLRTSTRRRGRRTKPPRTSTSPTRRLRRTTRKPPRTRRPRTSTRRMRGRRRKPPRRRTRRTLWTRRSLPRTMRPGSPPMRIPRPSTRKKKRKRSNPPASPVAAAPAERTTRGTPPIDQKEPL